MVVETLLAWMVAGFGQNALSLSMFGDHLGFLLCLYSLASEQDNEMMLFLWADFIPVNTCRSKLVINKPTPRDPGTSIGAVVEGVGPTS